MFTESGFPIRKIARARVEKRPHRLAHSAALVLALGLGATTAAAADNEKVIVGSSLAGAIQVQAEPRCNDLRPNTPEARLSWSIDEARVEGVPGAQQLLSSSDHRIDISRVAVGLERGLYTSITPQAGPEAAKAGLRSFVTGTLEPGLYYHFRVLVKTTDGWIASQPSGFLSPVCPADGMDYEKGGE